MLPTPVLIELAHGSASLVILHANIAARSDSDIHLAIGKQNRPGRVPAAAAGKIRDFRAIAGL